VDACTCFAFPDARDYLAGADVAFEGLLHSVEQRGHRLENVFQVDRVWKGEVGSEISIDTVGGVCEFVSFNDSCGIVLTQGERYLVFASFGYSSCMPTTDLCSGTRLSSGASEAFADLGPAAPPLDGGVEPPAPCNDTPCPDAGTAVGGSGGAIQIPADATASGGGGSVDAGGAGARAHAVPALDAVRESESAGCACSVPPASPRPAIPALLVLLAALAGSRRAAKRRARASSIISAAAACASSAHTNEAHARNTGARGTTFSVLRR
jgi:MYXO-CTERM domain-containing protein